MNLIQGLGAAHAALASTIVAQTSVERRLQGLRDTAKKLEQQSYADQAVPVLTAIAIAAMITVVLALFYQRLRRYLDYRQLVRKSRLGPRDVSWLEGLAADAGIEPHHRILASSSAFEQITTHYLKRQMASDSDWREDAERIRSHAERLRFASTETPDGVISTFDIGSPWPVLIATADGENWAEGFLGSDTIDEIVVHVLDDLGLLGDIGADDEVLLHVQRPLADEIWDEEEDEEQDDPSDDEEASEKERKIGPTFPCRIIRAHRKAPYRKLHLRHVAETVAPPKALAAAFTPPEEVAT